MNNNTGGPAFPGPYMDDKGYMEVIAKQQGMTLRDYFAAKAMQALLAHPDCATDQPAEVFARTAYVAADAMLKAREVASGS